jgi:hypothetical protein
MGEGLNQDPGTGEGRDLATARRNVQIDQLVAKQ